MTVHRSGTRSPKRWRVSAAMLGPLPSIAARAAAWLLAAPSSTSRSAATSSSVRPGCTASERPTITRAPSSTPAVSPSARVVKPPMPPSTPTRRARWRAARQIRFGLSPSGPSARITRTSATATFSGTRAPPRAPASRLIAAAMRVASDGVIGRNGADTVSAAA